MKRDYFEPVLEITQVSLSNVLNVSLEDPFGNDKNWEGIGG